MKILQYIPIGIENKISTLSLIEKTGLTQRQVCKEVEKERIKGNVILSSSSGGYWLPDMDNPDTKQQLEKYIAFMQSKNTFATTKSAKELLKGINNNSQIRLNI